MFKGIVFILILTCSANICAAFENNNHLAAAANQNHAQRNLSDQMLSLKIMLSKLRELIYSLKDINELEQVGLSHTDAELMRSILLEKINQTKSQTLLLIRHL